MKAEYLQIGENRFRVEANWNAITDFLDERGRDTFDGLTDIGKITPGDLAPLMAACIREGERLDGRPCSLTSKDVGAMPGVMDSFKDFLAIYTRQAYPKGEEDSAQKKTTQTE